MKSDMIEPSRIGISTYVSQLKLLFTTKLQSIYTRLANMNQHDTLADNDHIPLPRTVV